MSCCHTERKKRPDYFLWGTLLGVAALYGLQLSVPERLLDTPWLATMAQTTRQMMDAMWWGVVIGAVFIGVLSKVPRDFIVGILGEGGTVGGLLRATGAGVLLDLCSHGILMVAAKLYERGASAGQVVAFLLASPWNSLSLTLVLIGLIGLKWTMAFIVVSMLIAWVTGWIFDRLVALGVLPANPNRIELPKDFNVLREARKGLARTRFDTALLKDVVVNGVRDSGMVVRWLLFGVLLAAVLRAVLDPEMFGHYFGPTALGLMITVAVATVMEVCSEGSVPIAADILSRAGAPGNGFAFLMAGVATDYTEVMVLRDTTKSWRIPLFLPLVSVPQVLVVAWLMNVFG